MIHQALEGSYCQVINRIFEGKYDYVYLSFGSKFNEPTFEINGETYSTNATFQMFPGFLRYRPYQKMLIICVDDFGFSHQETGDISETGETSEIMRINTKIIERELDENVDFVFCNMNLTCESLGKFMEYFVAKLNESEISSDDFMVCNFIRFLHEPNAVEYDMEENASRKIKDVLGNDKYENCLYEWCGYGYNTTFYNVIYRYPGDTYNIASITMREIDVWKRKSKSKSRLVTCMSEIYTENKLPKSFGRFLTNSCDITTVTSCYDDPTKMSVSLMDELLLE